MSIGAWIILAILLVISAIWVLVVWALVRAGKRLDALNEALHNQEPRE